MKIELSEEELKMLIKATGLIAINILILEKGNADQYLNLQYKLRKIKKSHKNERGDF